MSKTVLIVAAHPDDEVLGCGGTIRKLVKKGYSVYTLILGEGVTSRDPVRDRKKREREIEELKEKAIKANKLLGVKEVFLYEFPDNRFDSVDLLDIIKTIERVKKEIQPDIIFTHSQHDLNIDHALTYKAVLTASRPVRGETVKEIYSFEVLSSSEWVYPPKFSPNLYIDISDTIEDKIKAMSLYTSELRKYPHPRSLEGIRILAKKRGLEVGFYYAEAFEVVRILRD
jgi:LmbE family N-acetylglucosaminyl deacetylase